MDDQYRSNFVGHEGPPTDDDDNKQEAPPQVMDFKPPSKHPTAPLVGAENDTISPEPAPPPPDEPDESPTPEEQDPSPTDTDDTPDSSSDDKPPEGDEVEDSSDGSESQAPEEPAETDTPTPGHSFSVETAMKEAAVPAVISSSGPAKRSHSKLATALIIVLIAAAMIAAALYFYLQNGKADKSKATSSTSTQQTTTAAEPAKSTDVDGTIKAIDTDTQTASDNKDISSSDLADPALGL